MFPKFLLTFLLLFFSHCTAANIWNLYNNTNNTNPTPEYNNFYTLLFRGGVIFHMNHSPGGVGQDVSSKFSGTSCSYSILYSVAVGNSTLEAAMKDGKIHKIATVSYEHLAVFFSLYHRFCTTVTGE